MKLPNPDSPFAASYTEEALQEPEANPGFDGRRYEDLPDVLTTQEVALYLGVHVKTIREYIRFGKIRALTFGKYYRVKKEWVIDFLEQNK